MAPQPILWSSVGTVTSLRLPVEALPSVDGRVSPSRIQVQACDKAGACSFSGWSYRVVSRVVEPTGGEVTLSAVTDAASGTATASGTGAYASPGFLTTSGVRVSVRAGTFTPVGCPSVCGGDGSAGVGVGGGGGGVPCFYDETCTSDPIGGRPEECNAGGQGRNCRGCGVGALGPCPEPVREGYLGQFGVLTYEMCIGTSPYGCQMLPFTSTSDEETWQVDALDLVCGSVYYATVRATNCAGLQRTVASASATLCCQPPTLGTLTLVDADGAATAYVSASTSLPLTVEWAGFEEVCSGVRAYRVQIRADADEGVGEGVSALVTAEVDGVSNSFTLTNATVEALVDGTVYTITVTAVSFAGLSSSVNTSFVVDNTPPDTAEVLVSWPSSAALTVPYRTFDSVCVPATAAAVEFDWSGMVDAESGVSTYRLGIEAEGVFTWMDMQGSTFGDFSLSIFDGLTTPRVAAEACNRVGLCTVSPWVLVYVLEAPDEGLVAELEPAGLVPGYLLPTARKLQVSWIWEDVSPRSGGTGYLEFEVCVGTTDFGCQVQSFVSASNVSSWVSPDLDLLCGETYFASVRATNCGGVRRAVATPGSKLCCDPPTPTGAAVLTDARGERVAFVSEESALPLNLSWHAFKDECSGVAEQVVSLISTEDMTEVWSVTGLASDLTTFELPLAVSDLANATAFTVTVEAISNAGLIMGVSANITVDRTPPSAGHVLVDPPCAAAIEDIRVAWEGFYDADSGIASAELAMGSEPFQDDLLPFAPVETGDVGVHQPWPPSSPSPPPGRFPLGQFADRTVLDQTQPSVPVGTLIYASLKVTDASGLAVLVTSNAVRVVDADCPTTFVCLPYTHPALGKPSMQPGIMDPLYFTEALES